MAGRGAIVAEARAWMGTPYRHQASLKGVGCDCLGLVRGVWRALLGEEPERVPGYTRDWSEAGGAEALAEAGRRHLVEIDPATARPGDVLVFRMRPGGPAKHAGILICREAASSGRSADTASGEGPAGWAACRDAALSRNAASGSGRFVHAYEGAGVVTTRLTRWWAGRLAYAFAFPGVDD
ncbi:NlpC/P60 family protein [Pseudoxanthobacter sp. M-2]|uniref:NlpC/P60 family protein n=1 Tax=Pseudoxanthobacter sp. M-2 TaxID=3078754 RepID=UPI0038FC35E1